MSFFAAAFERKASTLDLFREIYGTRLAKSGVSVTWKTAIKVATVLACARVRANGIAQVPLKIFTEQAGKKEPARDHPLYFLLHNQPNPWQTSFEYRETLSLHLDLCGRHYSFISRGVGGRVLELLPLEPDRVEPKRAADGTIQYTYTAESGATEVFPQEAIWHVRGLSWNGWQGLDAMDLAREAIGLSISAEARHAKVFANAPQASGVYSVEGALSPQQYTSLRKWIVDNTTGENSGMPMIVDRGAKWLQTAMSGADMQHLETRRFQIEEICRAMGVMPIMVGFADKTATYASAEQMFLAHVVHTLTPLWTRLEQSIDAYLLGRRDVERGFYAKFIGAGLLRGSMKDRADYFSKALGSGGSPAWMTQDEVRGLEEMNPMGGDAAKLPVATNVPPAQPSDTQGAN